MPTLGPIDLVGEGEYSFTLVNVFGGNARLTSLGPETSVYGTGGTQRVVRAGWIAFGYHFADPDAVSGTHLYQPQWIDFTFWNFTPFLYGVQGYAERLVWQMAPGTVGRLWFDTA